MRTGSLLFALSFCWVQAHAAAAADRIPAVRGETFAGNTVNLPEALHGGPGVLVIGFTEASRQAVTDWGTWLARDAAMSRETYYEMPMLAGVPKMLRNFVAGRIKAAVADSAKPHFLPLLDHEAEWRTVAGYTAADDAYVLLVDGGGTVRWRTHGPPTEQSRLSLRQGLAVSPPSGAVPQRLLSK